LQTSQYSIRYIQQHNRLNLLSMHIFQQINKPQLSLKTPYNAD